MQHFKDINNEKIVTFLKVKKTFEQSCVLWI